MQKRHNGEQIDDFCVLVASFAQIQCQRMAYRIWYMVYIMPIYVYK